MDQLFLKDTPAGSAVFGPPERPLTDRLRELAALGKLPARLARLRQQEQQIAEFGRRLAAVEADPRRVRPPTPRINAYLGAWRPRHPETLERDGFRFALPILRAFTAKHCAVRSCIFVEAKGKM